MSFSEQEQGDEISQKEDNSGAYREDNENKYNSNNNQQQPSKKKNRTLQYYKFLFYSMKTEIKIHDFLKLLRNSNTAELSIWTISVLLFANIPKNYPVTKEGQESNKVTISSTFLWLHLLHVIRAFLGMYLGYKLPRSYQIIDILQNLSDEKLEKTLFNDILRETIYNHVILAIKQRKKLIFIYFFLTVANLVIDLCDFLFMLYKVSSSAEYLKVVFLTYIFISIIYLVIDFSYVFWIGQLQYIFPPEYLKPIKDLYDGIVEKAVVTFKLEKIKTNVVSEAKTQQGNGPFVKSSGMNNGGYNILEYIIKDSLGMNQFGGNNKYLPNVQNEINNREIRGQIQNDIPNSNEILN